MALADRVRRYAPATLRHATPELRPLTLGDARPRGGDPQAVALSQCRSVAKAETIESGAPVAVLLRGSVWGDLWLVADDDVLAEHPDILGSGLPVVRFAELPHLQRLDAASLQALGIVKRTFPTSTVLQ